MSNRNKSGYLKPTMFDMKLLDFFFNLWINVVDPFHIMRRFIIKPSKAALSKLYEEYKVKTLEKLDGSQSLILRGFVISTVGFLLFCGAVLLYVLFYLMYMPTSTYVKPVHMQYNKICEDKACDLETMTSPFHSFPIAHLQLNKNQQMMVGQPYYISVRMELPETPRNQDLGIFMVCIDMKDKQNTLKSHACRSTMLRYRSPYLQIAKNLFFLPFHIFGMREEKQFLEVEMFSKYLDSSNSVTDIYVEIQSKVVEFYEVSLHINAHFTGLRFIIFNFPIIAGAIGIGMIFFLLAFTTLLLWYHYDYEMEWVEDARRKLTGKTSMSLSRQGSSSISTTDEHPSMALGDKLELEDDFMFDDSDSDKKQSLEE